MHCAALALIGLFALSAEGRAEPDTSSFAPVTTEVAGATIDWTGMVLTMTERAQPAPGARAELQVVEQQARVRLGPRLLEAAGRLRLDHDTTVRDLIDSGSSLGEHLGQESSSWHVAEARYHSSGLVEIQAELDLATWLRPVAYAGAADGDPPTGERSSFSGILIDARGLGAEGALAPRVLSPDGEELFTIERVHEAVARKRTVVQYVSDPADPRAYQRAGETPLLLRAQRASDGVDLVLTPDDAIRFQTVTRDARLLTEARLVLVLDP
jgi:hypothetical protein